MLTFSLKNHKIRLNDGNCYDNYGNIGINVFSYQQFAEVSLPTFSSLWMPPLVC